MLQLASWNGAQLDELVLEAKYHGAVLISQQ